MDKTNVNYVRVIMNEIEKALADSKLIAIEALFELDPFDREAQKDFEDAIDNS